MAFLNMNKLAKIVKTGYKGELVIGLHDGGYVIHTDPITLWYDQTLASNKLKAIIMEVIGKLPTEPEQLVSYGEIHHDRPDVLENLLADPIREIIDAEATEALKATGIAINGRLLLQSTATTKVYPIAGELAVLIDTSKRDVDENAPIGPAIVPDGSRVYWWNDRSILAIHRSYLSELGQEILRYLEPMKLYRDDTEAKED